MFFTKKNTVPGPFRFVTVVREAALIKPVIQKVIAQVKDRYTIVWAGNAETIEDIESVVAKEAPEIILISSTWKPGESREIARRATKAKPGVQILALPYKMTAEKTGAEVSEYILKEWDRIIEELTAGSTAE